MDNPVQLCKNYVNLKHCLWWSLFFWVVDKNFQIYAFFKVLTRHSAKRQAFAQIRKFNFEKSYALISMLWCLKYIYIWLTPFGPLYGGPGDPQVPKMAKPGTLYLYQIRWKCLRILCLLMPKSQNFRAILCNWENWEIFANFDSTNLKTWFSDSWQNFEWNFGATWYGCLLT